MSGPDTDSRTTSERTLVIEAGKPEWHYWRELWAYRELFLILAWRDVTVRYKQTVIGVAWAVIRPLLTVVIFSVLFGQVAGLPSEGDVPYPVMVTAGMLPWFLFSSILSDGAQSLAQNANLISKIYFPRLIIPIASSVVSMIDFSVTLLMLFILMIYYGVYPDWHIVTLPLFTVFGVACAIGPALIMTSLNVKYRDFRFIVPFIVQFGLYVSPVGFSSSVVPEKWRLLYSLNPMVGVIDGFRWSVLGGEARIDWAALSVSIVMVAALLWIGVRLFRATEKTFADLV